MRTAAILPIKRFTEAKQRLAESVAEELRAELVRAMIADVLLALAQTSAIERTIIVSSEPAIAAPAREHGALIIADTLERGQSAAVGLGVERALADGCDRVLCIPGDCPALDPAELEALLAGGEQDGAPVVIVPDRHGRGTNGLLLAPPDVIAASFGVDSCARHRGLAAAAGVACAVRRPASLLLDIDTGADLAALRERLSGTHSRARRTRAVLGEAGGEQLLPIASAG